MANKTIYVSNKDENVYKEAQRIAGEALSSVISRSLKEFIDRSKALKGEMREISVNVGPKENTREQRFIGNQIGKWKGFSQAKEYWQTAKIFETQKGNLFVLLTTVCKASVITKTKDLDNDELSKDESSTEALVVKNPKELEGLVSEELINKIKELLKKEEKKIEYLDI